MEGEDGRVEKGPSRSITLASMEFSHCTFSFHVRKMKTANQTLQNRHRLLSRLIASASIVVNVTGVHDSKKSNYNHHYLILHQ